ncbi:hypothetical protein [Rhodococcus sp. UNC23MFCrub1.1]|uniref:hypothetical protein n=1 Tax=Rhodococcus sp. UNC23MFCrub1.1 TaxID=1449068 RepID=UPI00068D1C3F|nr:hypothetical protein [Rhodococcus sp. UNC23MFCrub1.1]
MQSLFGDGVCTPPAAMGSCNLTAAGQVSSEIFEQGMSGGHCFGMAAVAGLWFRGLVDTAPYVSAGATVYDTGPSPTVDELIGRYFLTQGFAPTVAAAESAPVADIVDDLAAAWSRGEDYVLGFYTDADKNSGHAVTPIETRDLGDGEVGIVLYDNNFPGRETMLVANRDQDTWYYTTAADPADDSYLFVGGPDNQLELTPLTSMTGMHQCPMCEESDGSDYVALVTDGDPDADPASNEDPEWSLAVADANGDHSETIRRSEFFNNDNTALLEAPLNTPMRLTLSDLDGDADSAAATDLSIMGDGWVARLQSLQLDLDATLTVTADPAARTVTLFADAPTTADLTVAVDTDTLSRSATVRSTAVDAGQTVTLGTTGQSLILTDSDGTTLREVEMR